MDRTGPGQRTLATRTGQRLRHLALPRGLGSPAGHVSSGPNEFELEGLCRQARQSSDHDRFCESGRQSMSELVSMYEIQNEAENTNPEAAEAVRSATAREAARENPRVSTALPAQSWHRGHHLARSARLWSTKSPLCRAGKDAAAAPSYGRCDQPGATGGLAGRRGTRNDETKCLDPRDAHANRCLAFANSIRPTGNTRSLPFIIP